MKGLLRCLVLFAVGGLPAVGLGQRPHEDRPGHEGEQYVPRGGYIRTNKLFRIRRAVAEQQPDARRFPVYKLRGSRSLPVICVSFSDVPGPFPAADLQLRLFEGGPPTGEAALSMTQYYRDISHGSLLVTGQVLGWYSLPKEDSYYENGRNGDGEPFGELLTAGLDAADEDVDFGLFDNDGPDGVPNSGDDDGYVDTVFFVHPEAGAECGETAATNIWSHSWHYNDPGYGHEGPYVTDDPRLDADGQPVLNDDATVARILVDDYTVQPMVACPDQGAARLVDIGVFCHEYAHALGLPDLYDRTPQNGGDSEGVGNWCLMAGGSYGGDGDHAERPSHMSAWSKYYLGWSLHTPITTSGQYLFEPVEERGSIYRVDIGAPYGPEYFLVEWRDRDWRDEVYGMRLNWDADLPASGLAIWHVDESVGGESEEWPFAGLDKGQNDAASRPNAASHSLVAIEQADKQQDLESKQNRGDPGDLWVYGQSFEGDLVAGSTSYTGSGSGIRIYDINPNSSTFRIDIPVPGESVAAVSRRGAAPVATPARVTAPRKQDPVEIGDDLRSALTSYANGGLMDLTAAQQELINGARECEWGMVLPAQTTPGLRKELSILRQETAVFGGDERPDPRLLVLEQIQDPGEERFEVQFKLVSSQDRIERIQGLWFDRKHESLEDDAVAYFSLGLDSLLGEGVELSAEPARAGVNRVTFEQVFSHGEVPLPVFGMKTTVYYGPGAERLVALESHTVPSESLKVSGTPGNMSADLAERIVHGLLGAPEQAGRLDLLTREGIFLVDGRPEAGRVSHRVQIPVGAGRQPIDVYVDVETGQVLEVE